MRHYRCKTLHENVARLGEGEAQIGGNSRMLDGADGRRKRVDEFVDRGDADIEAEPLDVIFDLCQRGVRRPPDLGRLGGKLRGLRWPLGAHDPFDLANEPP